MRNFDGLQNLAASLAAGALALATPAFAWDTAVPLSSETLNAQGMRLLQDGKGRVMVSWTQVDGSPKIVSTVKPLGGSFGPVNEIAGATPHDGDYDIVGSKKGGFTAVWAESNASIVSVETSDLGKKDTSFTMPVQISAFGENKRYTNVESDKKGNTYVSWKNQGENGLEVAIRPFKGTFGAAQELALDLDVFTVPQLAVNPSGDAVVAWSTWPSVGSPQVHASVRRPGGEFAPAQFVSDAIGYGNYPWPTVAPDGSASIYFEVESVAHLGAEASLFDAPVDAEHMFNPVFRYDKKGNLYAFWTRSGGLSKAAFAVRPAGSLTFGPVSLFGSNAATHSDMYVDKRGGVRLVWVEDTGSLTQAVYTSYRPKGGDFSTPEPLTAASDRCSFPKVLVDKKGTTIVTYYKQPDPMMFFQNQIWMTTLPKQ